MQTAAPVSRPLVPDHDLLRRVGRGGYGEVWLARNVTGSFRAVKVVYRDSFAGERPYEREFSGWQQFEPVSRTHPGLVGVLHIGRNNQAGYFYCVMEAADDARSGQAVDPTTYQPRTLAGELSRRGRLPPNECIELGICLAGALGHLHARGLVHRDVKPSNIIFVSGVPKFADIGLVTQMGAKATYVGTEGYLAPEGPGSASADLYALGKVLYELSLGKAPDQFPELPTNLRAWPELDQLMRLNELVLRACQPQPAKRFHSAGEFQKALAQLRPVGAGGGPGATASSSGPPGAGAKVVVLLPGNSQPETELGRTLAERMEERGFAVFKDELPGLSVEWARALEQQIREARVVIPILSPASLHTETMAYALEVAHQAAQRPNRLPLLLPVCFQLREPLPRQPAVALAGADQVTIATVREADQVVEKVLVLVAPPVEAPQTTQNVMAPRF